ncbi:MAG: hypothetical protein A2X86_06255 [Bdellovibrionales bacterium GWA2_49_15]|nr:MAG: hypothetical protein A2X86_06255 [Bdellovibrionales bacterium GWA2_49_15]HAZ14665.1 hypothetical protein [Bdellovibrionales bacterium]
MKIKHSSRRWTIERILCEILKLPEVSAKHAQHLHADLYSAAIRHFSSWRKAVEAAGFEYQRVSKRKLRGHWSCERIVAEITQLSKKNSNHVRSNRRDLYSAAIRLFGNWQSAVEAAGFNYDEIRQDWVSSDADKIRFRKK